MSKSLRIAICQINPTVGDLSGNCKKIISFYNQARKNEKADIVIFPECALCGYPPEDLLLRQSFMDANQLFLKTVAGIVKDAVAILGFVQEKSGKVFNSAAVLQNSKVLAFYSKRNLPNYSVFDEKRYFYPGTDSGIIKVRGIPFGVSICEDIWEENVRVNHLIQQAKQGAKILINVSASPYYAGKFNQRLELLKKRVRQTRCPIIYVNMVGGQDELVFDGRSMVIDPCGKLILLAKSFQEDTKTVEFLIPSNRRALTIVSADRKEFLPKEMDEIYQALVLGTRDYVEKNGFMSVVLGLSGGIDSSLTACIAVEALDKDRVFGVLMPSRYSSKGTMGDAGTLAKNLGISCMEVPIERIFKSYLQTLKSVFKGTKTDITEENLQSRIRGTILMALSNKFGHLVLTTGNKSEVSVGYSTLYGDSAGGFAILKDIPKTMVYKLAKYVNQKYNKYLIPKSVMVRPPTAELKPHQKDQDTLPPYPILDEIIEHYVEKDEGTQQMERRGMRKNILRKVIQMIDSSEYKRRQSPPGIKITPKSFGKDRRMPITNRFQDL